MNFLKPVKIAVLAAVIVAVTSFGVRASAETAAPPNWEIFGATSSSLIFQSKGNGSGTDTTWVGYAGLNRFLTPQWEFGGNLNIRKLSSPAGDLSHVQVTIGPTYDFSDVPESSFYGTTQIGCRLTSLSSSRSYTTFAYYLAVGRRFALAEHVSWSPEISFSGRTEGTNGNFTLPSTNSVGIIPFQIAVLF